MDGVIYVQLGAILGVLIVFCWRMLVIADDMLRSLQNITIAIRDLGRKP